MKRHLRALAVFGLLAAAASAAAPAPAHTGRWSGKLMFGSMGLPGSGCPYDEPFSCLGALGYKGQNTTWINIQGHGGHRFELVASKAGLLGRADFDVCFTAPGGATSCHRNRGGSGDEAGIVLPNAAEARVDLYDGADAEFMLRTF